ncbi:Gfo/Idh/MocA family protein [Microlunatus sp. GCM10028923]|uniref:Gfo/Idh/MocA family protein n=1 Tax=Microlunatus sp. GCM10028923 TaxID=3273400 RepID=UPI00361518D1
MTDEQKKLRAGVVGLGWAGQQHMQAYFDAANADLVALAGMESEKLAELGDKYGVERRYPDWESMVRSGDLDVISVATPTALHAPIAVGALNAGIHVLSEKPMAESGAAAATMVQAAKDNDRVLDVSFNHRQRGEVTALKEIVDRGRLGQIYYAKAGWLRRQGIPGLGTWFTRASLAGGGAMMDIGVHMLDMALHLLGNPQVSSATAATYAEFGPRGRGGSAYGPRANADTKVDFEVEDLSTAFLRLDGGGTLLLESSWAQWIPYDQCYVALYGSEGGASIEWGGWGVEPYQRLNVWTEIDGIPAELQPIVPPAGHHEASVLQFLDKVQSGKFGDHRGEEALIRAKVLDGIYASAAKGTEVAL